MFKLSLAVAFLWFLVSAATAFAVVYVVWHFISKLW